MTKWNMIVDVERCHNCNNCFLGCKDEYVGNDYPGYSAAQPLHGHKWINILTKERGSYPMVDVVYVPTMCNHCDDAPCIKAGDGAVRKREDGIVIIDPVASKGKKNIVNSCPYGAIWWNDDLEIPQAWTFDAHLLDRGWTEPRCVQGCPTGALKSVKVTDREMKKIIDAEGLEALSPEHDTKPRVHYKNLHRYNRVFIGGSVVADINGTVDCVADADIELIQNGSTILATLTDAFGEFRIDGIEENSGAYDVHISHPEFKIKKIETLVKTESVVLGTVKL
jgi:Fe-S-cluster-containing dehydrogenase component